MSKNDDDEGVEEVEIDFNLEDVTLLSASEDLLKAIEEKNAEAVSAAFKEMFHCLMEEHEEMEAENEEEAEMKSKAMFRGLKLSKDNDDEM